MRVILKDSGIRDKWCVMVVIFHSFAAIFKERVFLGKDKFQAFQCYFCAEALCRAGMALGEDESWQIRIKRVYGSEPPSSFKWIPEQWRMNDDYIIDEPLDCDHLFSSPEIFYYDKKGVEFEGVMHFSEAEEAWLDDLEEESKTLSEEAILQKIAAYLDRRAIDHHLA